jgi:hypothetical protein
LVQAVSNLRYQFVMTELVVGITHCRAAFTTGDPIKKEHNRRKAEIAYRSARDLQRGGKLALAMRKNILDKSAQLKALLAKLQASTNSSFPEG